MPSVLFFFSQYNSSIHDCMYGLKSNGGGPPAYLNVYLLQSLIIYLVLDFPRNSINGVYNGIDLLKANRLFSFLGNFHF